MTTLPSLTPDTARGAAQHMLTELVERHGEVGPMVRTMANSPAVLGGYLQLSRSMKRAKLDRRIRERISIAVQARQGMRGLPASPHLRRGLTRRRRGRDLPRPQGNFGRPAHRHHGRLRSAGVRRPLGHHRGSGRRTQRTRLGDREIADVVGVVALNVLTGAFNLVAWNRT